MPKDPRSVRGSQAGKAGRVNASESPMTPRYVDSRRRNAGGGRIGTAAGRLIGAVAFLTAARSALAEADPEAAAQFVARARSGWPVPAWLDHRLNLAESRACLAAGDIEAALAAAKRAGSDSSPEAAATLAHAWVAAGDAANARRALEPALAAHDAVPERVRLQALLADARLSYGTGDPVRGRRSLASALRLAEPEQLRLPFVIERAWIGPALRRDPELARACQPRPSSIIIFGLRRRPWIRPRSWRPSRLPDVSWRCCGTSQAC